jgi:hypothetical protein
MPAWAKPISIPATGFRSAATGKGEFTAMVVSGKIVEFRYCTARTGAQVRRMAGLLEHQNGRTVNVQAERVKNTSQQLCAQETYIYSIYLVQLGRVVPVASAG